MSITVVCPGCYKRFKVADKFAGKTGPCPECKTPLRIPTKAEEVKVHARGEDAEEGSPGADIVIKPIERSNVKWSPVVAAAIGGAVVVVFLVTWLIGRAGLFEASLAWRAVGLLIISPPLVIGGYTFLRDSEDLDPYRGKPLYLRAGICSLAYIILWWVYGYGASQLLTGELWSWCYVAPPFFLLGGLVALASLDLDYTSGLFHYSFYVLVTVFLRAIAGLGWVWQVANNMGPPGMP